MTRVDNSGLRSVLPFAEDISPERFRDFLVWLFLLGLILRAAFMVEHARTPSFGVPTLDQKYYDTAARMILKGEDLRPLRGIRPLLYPILLAGCYEAGGRRGIELALALQHGLGILTGILVAVLAAQLFRHRASGLVAGALYLLAPVPLYFESELLVESSYTFLICAALLVLFQAAQMPGKNAGWWWLAGGGILGFAAQERPNILVLLLAFPVLAAVWRWRRRARAWAPLLAWLGALAVMAPWGFVNQMQSGHFQVIPSAGGFNLYLGNKRTADGMVPEQERRISYNGRYQDSVEVWARESYDEAMRRAGRIPEQTPMAVSRYWTGRAMEQIKSDPGPWFRLMAKKSWLMLWNEEIPNNRSFAFLQTEHFLLRSLPIRWAILLMLAPAGIWAALKWGNRTLLFLAAAYILLYSAADVLFFVCDRYRYPIWPALAMLAGGGWVVLCQAILQRAWKMVWMVGAAAALTGFLSFDNLFDVRLPNFARDYLFRSMAWYEKNHFSEALRDASQSIALDPGDVNAWQQRGNALLALQQYGGARNDLSHALHMDPADGSLWNNYGAALDHLGQTNAAMQAYFHATQCQPPSDSAFLALAMDQIRLGQWNAASQTLRQYEIVSPEPDAIQAALASLLAEQSGDAPRAAALAETARRLDAGAAQWVFQSLKKPVGP